MKDSRLIKWFSLAFFILVPIILLLLPATYFDEGQTLCLSKRLFQMECPGCGMTRGIMHLIHFDLASAIYYNYLSVVVAPILAFMWFTWTKQTAKSLGLL